MKLSAIISGISQRLGIISSKGVDNHSSIDYNINSMDLYEVPDVFKKTQPTDIEFVKKLGYKTRRIGSGLFRSTYSLKYDGKVLPYVVKVPRPDESNDNGDGIVHAQAEIDKIKTIRKSESLSPFHRYLPRIYYFNENTGLLLERRYEKFKNGKGALVALMLSNLATDLGRDGKDDESCHGGDLHDDNVMYYEDDDNNQVPVIIDLGYF